MTLKSTTSHRIKPPNFKINSEIVNEQRLSQKKIAKQKVEFSLPFIFQAVFPNENP